MRRAGSESRAALPRQVAATEGRPLARGSRRRSPNRTVTTAAAESPAAASSAPRGESAATSSPPRAYPAIWVTPAQTASSDRPGR